MLQNLPWRRNHNGFIFVSGFECGTECHERTFNCPRLYHDQTKGVDGTRALHVSGSVGLASFSGFLHLLSLSSRIDVISLARMDEARLFYDFDYSYDSRGNRSAACDRHINSSTEEPFWQTCCDCENHVPDLALCLDYGRGYLLDALSDVSQLWLAPFARKRFPEWEKSGRSSVLIWAFICWFPFPSFW